MIKYEPLSLISAGAKRTLIVPMVSVLDSQASQLNKEGMVPNNKVRISGAAWLSNLAVVMRKRVIG